MRAARCLPVEDRRKQLELLDTTNTLVARFEAVYLRLCRIDG